MFLLRYILHFNTSMQFTIILFALFRFMLSVLAVCMYVLYNYTTTTTTFNSTSITSTLITATTNDFDNNNRRNNIDNLIFRDLLPAEYKKKYFTGKRKKRFHMDVN